MPGFAQLLNAWIDGRRIDAVRPLAHQAHDRCAVSGVANAGGRERTVQADLHASHIIEQMLIDQSLGKGRRCTHRTDGMGTGRADTHFE